MRYIAGRSAANGRSGTDDDKHTTHTMSEEQETKTAAPVEAKTKKRKKSTSESGDKKAAPKKQPKLSAVSTIKRRRGKGVDEHEKISKAAIVRLARRGGVKRIESSVYPQVRLSIETRVNELTDKAMLLAELCKRKTVMVRDVRGAAQSLGYNIYE